MATMRPDLPTGTVTFLFTDIEGSTRLLHELGPDAYGDALAQHRRALREAFGQHGGVEVDTQGDAFFVAFPTADDAAAAALAANERLRGGPISVRMGLHTGAPTLTAEGYVGSDVHRGARVAALAHGGQIVVSPTTAALLDGYALGDLGSHRLKDFDGATQLAQLGEGSFPPLRTPGSVELPAPATPFLGREHELFDAVSLCYERDPRVLTVLGPGGTGKTRFTLELCRLLAEEAEGGTVFCALAPVRDPGLVLPMIAERLGAAAPEPAAIAARIGAKRTHVLVDNAEHLLPHAARPLAELAAALPTLRLLVTCRVARRVPGAVELDLPPLTEGEATALFLERAHAVRPDLEDGEAVGELCARLDYLPLALELAAARTKLLSPEALLERLQARLDLQGTRDADERHATLRATIAWSYDLLDTDEQRLFRRLSVFRGSCTLEAAESVCDADLAPLAGLLDKSLIRRRTDARGKDRFWMLETIRDFALEQLAASEEAEEIRRRHAERMLEVAESGRLGNHETASDILTGLSEREELRAALDWAAESDVELGLRLMVALENFWVATMPGEGMRRVRALLARGASSPVELRATALRTLGGTADQAGERDAADRAWEESLELFRTLGDDRSMAGVEHRLAVSAWRRGDWESVRRLTESGLERSRGKFTEIEITSWWLLGQLRLAEGDVEGAIELTRRSAAMARDIGWAWWESGQLHELLVLALRRNDLDDAERDGRSALAMEREQENRLWTVYTLAGLAQVALARGEADRAGLLWGAAEREGANFASWEEERASRGGALVDDMQTSFLAALERGRQLDLWDAVAIALGEDPPAQTVP
jgi:predicted ATPase/class 3 adenylate cyclase